MFKMDISKKGFYDKTRIVNSLEDISRSVARQIPHERVKSKSLPYSGGIATVGGTYPGDICIYQEIGGIFNKRVGEVYSRIKIISGFLSGERAGESYLRENGLRVYSPHSEILESFDNKFKDSGLEDYLKNYGIEIKLINEKWW